MTADEKAAAKKDEGNNEVLKAIAALSEPDRSMGERLHSIITTNAPSLLPRTWYGMPAYSDGNKIVCFFRGRQKFGERYLTFGFNDTARLDDGNLWPISFAITKLTAADEAKIAGLVQKAVS